MVNFAWKSGGPLLSIGTVCRELYKKMAEPIKILFGMKAWVGPSNHILDGGQDHIVWNCQAVVLFAVRC